MTRLALAALSLAVALLAFPAGATAAEAGRCSEEAGTRCADRLRFGTGPGLRSLRAIAAAAEAGDEGLVDALNGSWGQFDPGPAASPLAFQNPYTPTLPDLRPTLPTPTPTPEVRPTTPATPVQAGVSPVAPKPDAGDGPCDDLRRKARRLRAAADQCDVDVAGGAPYCNVSVTFTSPNIPSSLPPGTARQHAHRFDDIASSGDEQFCASQGGIGRIAGRTPALSRPDLLARLVDIFNTAANAQVKDTLWEFFRGGTTDGWLRKVSFGHDASWTVAMKSHEHMPYVRQKIVDAYNTPPGPSWAWHSIPFTLNNMTASTNARIFLRDIIAPVVDLNMAYTTGSVDVQWRQRGPFDPRTRLVPIEFRAKDKLRLGSATRLPTTNWSWLPDDAWGADGPMHTIELEWTWTEVISI